MIVYFITGSGQILTNETIQDILEKMVMQEKLTEQSCIFRCGPALNNPKRLVTELNSVKDKYLIVYYIHNADWMVLSDDHVKILLGSIEDKTNRKMLSSEVIHNIVFANK